MRMPCISHGRNGERHGHQRQAELVFDWELVSMSGGTATQALRCALPHHLPVLQETPQAGTGYPDQGQLALVLGARGT